MDTIAKKKILLVEDDTTLSEMYEKKLSVEGFDIIVAHSGGAGFQMAIQYKPDLILLDILLPEMSGMTVMRKIRENPWGRDVPIIILTNLNADDNIIKGVTEDHPAYYLMKSNSDPAGVVEKIREVLKLS